MEFASNKLKFDIINSSEKYLLYMQNIAWICSSYLIVALTDYANNPIFQELPNFLTFFAWMDKRMYMRASKEYIDELEKLKWDHSELTLKINFKTPITKKMCFRICEYSQRKYLYSLAERRVTMKYKSFAIAKKREIVL